MTSKPVALLLADLGVTKTHSRPYVSNDNPFSEAQFKTLKYRPEFPDRFGSIEDARGFGHVFFPWYNTEHHHSGLGLLTPHDVHYGLRRAARRRAGPRCWPRPTPPIPSASSRGFRVRRRSRPRSGSTSRRRRSPSPIAIPSPRSSRTSRPEPRRAPQRTRPIPRYPPESASESDSDQSAMNSISRPSRRSTRRIYTKFRNRLSHSH